MKTKIIIGAVLALVGGFVGITLTQNVALGASVLTYTKSLIPDTTNVHYVGTSSPSLIEYRGIYVKDITISGTCTGCSAGAFPFTVNSWGNSTTSVLGFTNGFISNASSTQVWSNLGSSTATTFALPSITNALLWTNGNGVINSTTTGLVSAGTGISVTASRYVIGGALTVTNDGVTSISATSPLVNNQSTGAISLTCPTCATFTYPFPLAATSTLLSFTGGIMSSASSTFAWHNSASSSVDVFAIPNLTSALLLTNGNGLFAEYAGTSCTNQFARSLSVLGVATCATVGTADVAGLDISDDTNLAVTYPITLTGDTVGFTATSTWIVGASTSTTSFYSGILQALTARFTNITATSGVTFADGYTQTRGAFSFGATDVNATTTDIFTMQSFGNAVTIRSISGVIDCPNGCIAAPSGITVKFWHGTNRSASTSATALFTVNPTFTSTTTLQTFNTGFNDATLAAGEILWYQIVAASTTQMSIDFTGTGTND